MMYVCKKVVKIVKVVKVVPGAKNFFGSWHGNAIWKTYSEMYLKKVMYNQHDSYMHTPISAFACYDTPLQASYQSDTCKRRTISTKRITNKRMVGVWLSCHLPLGSIIIHSGEPPRQSPLCPPLSKLMRKKSHWRTVMCVGLVSRLASPNSLHRRDNQPYYIHSSWSLTALIKSCRSHTDRRSGTP